MGLDDAVEDVAPDEAKVSVDGGRGTAGKGPGGVLVVWERGIGVLKISESHCRCGRLVRVSYYHREH